MIVAEACDGAASESDARAISNDGRMGEEEVAAGTNLEAGPVLVGDGVDGPNTPVGDANARCCIERSDDMIEGAVRKDSTNASLITRHDRVYDQEIRAKPSGDSNSISLDRAMHGRQQPAKAAARDAG